MLRAPDFLGKDGAGRGRKLDGIARGDSLISCPMRELTWLPARTDWQQVFKKLPADGSAVAWQSLRELANARLSFSENLQLGRAYQKRFEKSPPEGLTTKPVRLAVLGSSTVDHVLPGIRIGALRRNLWVSTYTAHYGQYLQELLDPGSPLHGFKPDAVLFMLDAQHLFGAQILPAGPIEADAVMDEVCRKLQMIWKTAKDAFGCQVIQQTVVPLAPGLLGQNEQRLPLSQRRLTLGLNERLRGLTDAANVDLLALDEQIAQDGISAWHDPLLWHKAKQEISPQAAAHYGDLAGRLLGAAQGRSAKCLVLDLDNTLWGGGHWRRWP